MIINRHSIKKKINLLCAMLGAKNAQDEKQQRKILKRENIGLHFIFFFTFFHYNLPIFDFRYRNNFTIKTAYGTTNWASIALKKRNFTISFCSI